MGDYRCIVADPPWEIPSRIKAGGRRARDTTIPYGFMTVDQIKALPVTDMAHNDAHLYLWATRRMFREGTAAAVARAWGFEPCGEIIWGLRNPGMGAGPNINDHEPVLVARRGTLPFTSPRGAFGVAWWRQPYINGGKAHSAKPEAFLDLVEASSPGPRLELFARRQRLGWDTWGNEALCHVDLSTGEATRDTVRGDQWGGAALTALPVGRSTDEDGSNHEGF